MALLASLIDFLGSLYIFGGVALALQRLIQTGDLRRCQVLIADAALAGLSFKVAGTLLKALELGTWNQILTFTVIFALRTGLKRVFTWERKWG